MVRFSTPNYADFKTVIGAYNVNGNVFYGPDGVWLVTMDGGTFHVSVNSNVPSFATVSGDFPQAVQLNDNPSFEF